MANQNDQFSDAPSALYTGGSSKMFGNETLHDQNRKKREFEARQAARPKGVKGLLTDLQGVVNAAQLENDSFGSYMRTMVAKGKGVNAADVEVEFRAREMNLELINRIQKCLDKYKTPTQG